MRRPISAATTRLWASRAAMAVLVPAGLMLAACGTAGPPPKTYVLGAAPTMEAAADPLVGRPVIEVQRVLLTDYLDTTDILVRGPANLVEPSRTGRWRERLSVGVAHALATALSRRLPNAVIATTTPPETAACELQLDVEAFEADASRRVAFVGQWRVLGAASHNTLAGERVSFSEPVDGAGDEPVVAVMSRMIGDLGERIATAIRGLGPTCTGSPRKRRS